MPLIGGSIFMLVTGVANIDLWYPWLFFFPAGHYAVAWVTIGALVVHVGAKASISRRALRRPPPEAPATVTGRRRVPRPCRRNLGRARRRHRRSDVSPLRRLALLAPRRPDIGVQGFPVNKTAIEAGVQDTAEDADFALSVESGGEVLRTFTVDELGAMPMRSATLPISCVEGWSASCRWTGVSLHAVLEQAGLTDAHEVEVMSLQRAGRYRSSLVNGHVLADDDTILALRVNGEPWPSTTGFPYD